MKNHFIVTLLIVLMSGTMAMAQTKKPTTTTKKPTTTVKSSVPKTTTTQKTTTTTTTTTPVTPPPVVEEKKTTTTTTTTETPTEKKSTTTPSTTTTTTTTQSSGPSKGKKTTEPRVKEPNSERVREPKPERVREPRPERVREPRPERVRTPREANGSSGGVKFGIRAEASQFISFQQGAGLEFSPGFNAGLIVNIPISEKLAVQPEVLYSMTSVKSDYSAISGNAGDYVKYTGGSILTPIFLNINLGNGPTKFMINLGGYAEYALSASSEESTSGIKTTVPGILTNGDRFFYGVAGGIGVKLSNKFSIETRSFYDLKNANSNSIFTTFGIGYLF